MGGADDDWGRYLRIHGLERPNDRNKTDPNWLQKYQGVPWHLEERFHSDVFIGDSALTWIRDYKGQSPFFLQVGFTGPHGAVGPAAEASGAVLGASNAAARAARGRVRGQAAPARSAEKDAR